MYGLIIAASLIFSLIVLEKLAKKENLDTNHIWNASVWCIIFGIFGARAYHVLDQLDYYRVNPLLIPQAWYGGLGIIGGMAGGLIAVFIYLKVKNQPIKPWVTLIAVVFPSGMAIGRLANLANAELLPYALYESILCALAGILLLITYLRKVLIEYIIYLSISMYALIRIVLERFHPEPYTVYGLSVVYISAITTIVTSLILVFKEYRQQKSDGILDS